MYVMAIMPYVHTYGIIAIGCKFENGRSLHNVYMYDHIIMHIHVLYMYTYIALCILVYSHVCMYSCGRKTFPWTDCRVASQE